MKIYLAVDLGAESGRIIAGNLAGTEEIYRFPGMQVSVNGRLMWDILGIYREICIGLRKAFSMYGNKVAGIGVDSWGVDFGLLDENGDLLFNPLHYRDPGISGAAAAFFEKCPWDEVYMETGVQFLPFNTLYQLYSLAAEKPCLIEAASHFLNIPDLINYWLTGKMANEATIAGTTQLLNPVSRSWSHKLINAAGLNPVMFHDVVEPGTILGPLLPSVADDLGAPSGVMVSAVCGHDTAAAVAACPLKDREHSAYLSSGTWSLIGKEMEKPVITKRSMDLNYTNETGACGTVRFLKNITGLWVLQECRKVWEKEGRRYGYQELSELAAAAEESGIFRIDLNAPQFIFPNEPGNSMPERIKNECRRTGQPVPQTDGGTVRGIFESLAFIYAEKTAELESLTGSRIETLHIIGGGSRNIFLNNLTAKACRLEVLRGPAEASSMGNIMMQMIAAGEICSLDEGRAAAAHLTDSAFC